MLYYDRIFPLCVMLAACCPSSGAWAKVGTAEAAKLGTMLTPLGGDMAGNKEGTIPAWTGGYQGTMSVTQGARPDPFAGEKPLLVITPANVATYAAKLPQGVLELFKAYPATFHINVYPPHRTARAPQWVYDNTRANATRAESVNDGVTIKGAFGGIPFPIPANGAEAMWNHLLRWRGTMTSEITSAHIGTADGSIVLSAIAEERDIFPYYDQKGSVETFDGIYWKYLANISGPAYQAGNNSLSYFDTDPVKNGFPAWQYLPGQRRVRKSPNLSYDQPNFFLSGLGQFDEINGFEGPLDRYTFRLAGKQEMFVPYNANRMWQAEVPDQMKGGHYANPEILRFELHRVWVVDAALAPGKRNVVPKRRFFLDEDTWQVLAADEYDASGAYWRHIQSWPILMADIPGTIIQTFAIYDFKRGNWAIALGEDASIKPQVRYTPLAPDLFTPDSLAASGVQ